jgi:hypothetical protein
MINEALITDRSGSEVLEVLLRDQTTKFPSFDSIGLKETIGIACWYLWWIRRQRTHDEPVPPLGKCKMSILSIVANAAKVKANSGTRPSKWCKPPPRYFKVNVDDSFYHASHAGSIGAVIRDSKGDFIAALTLYLPHMASPVEAMAMREGVVAYKPPWLQ